MKETIAQSVAEVQEHVVAHRRTLHQIPEVGLDLPQTAGYVRKILTELGCIPQNIGTCGQVVTLGQGERTLLLRADMDALQVEEHNDLPFCAANGCMHACGHDMHTAILLGAAEVLKRHEQELPCRVLEQLTAREFELLRELLSSPGRVFTREILLAKLWGYDFFGDERVVDSHIKNLRKKLGVDYIETVRGVGYRVPKEHP